MPWAGVAPCDEALATARFDWDPGVRARHALRTYDSQRQVLSYLLISAFAEIAGMWSWFLP